MKRGIQQHGSCSYEERDAFCEKWDQNFYNLEKADDSVEYCVLLNNLFTRSVNRVLCVDSYYI